MSVALSPATQKLLARKMKSGEYPDADTLVRHALELLERVGEPYEELDEETRAAIERAEQQAARGEARPWKVVKAELQKRFFKK